MKKLKIHFLNKKPIKNRDQKPIGALALGLTTNGRRAPMLEWAALLILGLTF